MREVLLEERFDPRYLPVYNKDPGPAYIVNDVGVIVIRDPHRVIVPSLDIAESDCDRHIFTLVRTAAELGNWIDYDLEQCRRYFEILELPLHTVVKHPDLSVPLPEGVQVAVNYHEMPLNRFYCIAAPEFFGVATIHGTQRGFCIYNPKALLTVFVGGE